MKEVRIIGIDCAVDPANTGLCRGDFSRGVLRITAGRSGADREPYLIAADWMDEETGLIGMDAPLGWPSSLGRVLAGHQAGDPIDTRAHALFRRYTDDATAERTGKRPMDVGADRIARTAHAALKMLGRLREVSGQPVPLGWTPGAVTEYSVLETYPAAWLTVAGLPNRGYKRTDQRLVREKILASLPPWVEFECEGEVFLEDADVLDALLCTLICTAYLTGEVVPPPPEKVDLTAREGWIWNPTEFLFRGPRSLGRPDQTGSFPAITSR